VSELPRERATLMLRLMGAKREACPRDSCRPTRTWLS
jgi:hypothetical protein